MMLLQLENISKHYEAVDGVQPPDVVKEVSLELDAGRSLAIVGPSGSGKSTLLNIIGGLDRPSTGRVLLEGRDLAKLNDDELSGVRNEKIGFVFQAHHLLPQCTVLENVLVPALALHQRVADKVETRARKLLERVGLSNRLAHRPGQLSGGERQRVAVVRALVNQPSLLLADEPTGSLDRAAADHLAELLTELNAEQGVTLIVVTHAPALAEKMTTRLELRDGRLQPLHAEAASS